MIDIRYHIASIIAVFLALGLGVLIGSTIVGNDVLVEQQSKMIDRLDKEFYVLRERESELEANNEFKTRLITNYENFSQALLPLLVSDRLSGYKIAVVVSGDSDIPAGMINALSIAGAEIVSKTVVLSNMKLDNQELQEQIRNYYNITENKAPEDLRSKIAADVAGVINNNGNTQIVGFLQEKELVKFSGDNKMPVNSVIIVGGSENPDYNFAASFDQALTESLIASRLKVYGVESSIIENSFMTEYQKNNISTVDDVDLSPGQISLVFAMEGEAGHYGVKPTAQKFMPSLPVDAFGGR